MTSAPTVAAADRGDDNRLVLIPSTAATSAGPAVEPTDILVVVLCSLRGSARGLNGRVAARRLIVNGPNELTRRGKRQRPQQLLAQFTQPLALPLVVVPVLAAGSGSAPLAIDAVEEDRRIYDDVRKFIFYIFTHAVPEIAPFLLFALFGGAVPLSLTGTQSLAIDLVTDTLPALALSREPTEPGTARRPPRPQSERVIPSSLLARAWSFSGSHLSCLVLGGFFFVLHRGGWHLHSATGRGAPLHHLDQQATTVAWAGIVACQIGTAFAARTDRTSL